MTKSVIDAFDQCVDVSADVRLDLARNVYASKYLGLFMTLINENDDTFGVISTQYFLEGVATRYAHGDINDVAGIKKGLLSLFDSYLLNRRIIDFDLNAPFFKMVDQYYVENLGGRFKPAKYRNYVNGYFITDPIKSDQDIETAINNSIFHNDTSCQDIDGELILN
ncbi:hypothetical protein [Lactobacillus sp. Sy-1]|uniref:hypothetical protein n=1 Tax=Lactobacillus sp. Sy-1 TaxID=2109645 RepID=UPI001C5BDD78|nr:hypothetical protein [Lactobacillus sp. Sy-1]MBW1606227.1 hypothetical protein [Lactobacillus sp. Sy-1]